MGVYANTHGFIGHRRSSDHSVSCGVIARAGEDMQTGHHYSSARAPGDLWSPEVIGAEAGRPAAARKLGQVSIGKASDAYTVLAPPGPLGFEALFKGMGTGLLVTGLMGQGVNAVAGDCSRRPGHASWRRMPIWPRWSRRSPPRRGLAIGF